MRHSTALALAAMAMLAWACGDSTTNLVDDGADGGPHADAFIPENCVAGPTQCSNCMDDDDDGLADGFDPECTGAADDREDSFETGINGDNKDPKKQDCFFDGNSGGGQSNDCNFHTCCVLDLAQQPGGVCPAALQPPAFDPQSCVVTQACIDHCEPLVPPGCDCFGCCTVCDSDSCRDIFLNQGVAPNCTLEVLDDPTKCPACTKTVDCSSPCNPLECILCPGQTPDDLPDNCGGNECPDGAQACATSADCAASQFCAAGCCIDQIG